MSRGIQLDTGRAGKGEGGIAWRIYVVVALIGLIVGFTARFWGLHPRVTAIVEMSATTGRHGEVFFRKRGEPYVQDNKVQFQIKPDGKWHRYTVQIPAGRWHHLRVDPSVESGEVAVRHVEVRRGLDTVILEGKPLSAATGWINMLLPKAGRPGEVRFATQGDDPFIEFVLPIPAVRESLFSRITCALATGSVLGIVVALLMLAVETLKTRLERVQGAPAGLRNFYVYACWSLTASFAALGLCMAFGLPVFAGPDEDHHWAAGHARLERTFGGIEGCVPTLLPNDDYRRRTPEPPLRSMPAGGLRCEPEWDVFGDIMAYPGVLLSKVILPRQNESAIRQMQAIILGRLLQGLIVALCFVRMVVLAGRTRRPGALTTLAFALSPLLAQQAFTITYDEPQLGFAVCLLGIILFFDALTWVDVALMGVLGWGSASKPGMLTCILPSLIVGYWFAALRNDPSTSIRGAIVGFFRSLKPNARPSVQTVMLWLGIATTVGTVMAATVFSDPDPYTLTGGPKPGVDPAAQLDRLISAPGLLWHLVKTLPMSPYSLPGYLGPLGWLDAPVSRAVTNAFTRMLVAAVVLDLVFLRLWSSATPSEVPLFRRIRSAILPTLLGTVGPIANFFLFTAILYLTWTPVGSSFAEGVQVRYFLGSSIVLIAVLLGGVGTLLPAAEPGGEAAQETRVSSIASKLAGSIAVLLVVSQTLPYVARVFIDLARRYG